ncbi:MAG: AEC family transporter [Dorea sp.]|nr:AEC family transporter [Dorea sp.]
MSLFTQMIHLQLTLFMLIIIGLTLKKTGIITQEGQKCLSDITVNVILPCNIISSFMGDMNASGEFIRNCSEAFFISLGIQMFSVFFGKYCFFCCPEHKRKIFTYGIIVSNSSFIGLPVIHSLYGAAGVLYTSFFQIPVRLTMWSSGLALFTDVDRTEAYKKLAKHPCIVAVALGAVIMAFNIPFPAFLQNTLEGISKCMVPVSMFAIGAMLAESDIRRLFDWQVLYYCLLRLAVYPLLILGVLKLFNIDSILCNTIVLLSAMPMAGTTAILADKYGCGPEIASQTIFVSTLLSIVTLPVFMIVL